MTVAADMAVSLILPRLEALERKVEEMRRRLFELDPECGICGKDSDHHDAPHCWESAWED